jgi:hypothetical protein
MTGGSGYADHRSNSSILSRWPVRNNLSTKSTPITADATPPERGTDEKDQYGRDDEFGRRLARKATAHIASIVAPWALASSARRKMTVIGVTKPAGNSLMISVRRVTFIACAA